jgi:N-acetylneuraminic acid mutarotase
MRPRPSDAPPLLDLLLRPARGLAVLAAGSLALAATGCEIDGPPPEAEEGWARLAPVPEARTEVSVARIDERVYMLGGFGEPGDDERPPAPTTMWVYHTGDDRWESAGEIPGGGTHHAALVEVGGRLYLLGGYIDNSFRPRGDVHIYDPAMDAWMGGAPMPTPRGALAYAVVNGRIHTVGGTVADKDALDPELHNTDSPDASVGTHEVYDPVADSWERLAPMPTARNHHVAEGVGGRLVVTAGRAGDDFTMTATEIYDPETDGWSEGAPLRTGRSGVAAAVLDEWMYVFGGETFDPGAERTFDEAERYSLEQDRWEAMDPMPTARHGLGAATVGGAIYVVSGGPGPGFTFGTANERLVPPDPPSP